MTAVNVAKHSSSRIHSTGTILILVLIVLASMTALTMGLAYRTQIDIKLAQTNAHTTKAYYLALGGIERAIALLCEQELTEQQVAVKSRFSSNARQEGLFEQIPDDTQSGQPELLYSIHDEQAYFNINGKFADRFEFIAGREQAAQILDWIDEDNEPLGTDGAESDHYLSQPVPYIAGNQPLQTLRELLYLKDVSYPNYTGEDLNKNSLLDDNERDGSMTGPADNGDNVLDAGLLDLFTVYGNDQININTASVSILNAIGGLDDPPVAELLKIHRAGPDGRLGTDDDVCFSKPEDLVLEGLTETQQSVLQDTSKFCFTSEYFRVFAYTKSNKTTSCSLMASVHCSKDGPSIICLERLP